MLSINRNKSLLMINGPAGYGKTTLTLEFLQKEKAEFSWLSISSEMNNFYTFMEHLIYSIKRINNDFGEVTLELLEDYGEKYSYKENLEKIISDIISTFINELISKFKNDIYFILDDLGIIENSEWLRIAFNKLFENLPSNFHIVITSRMQPDFNTATLQAKRSIFKIGIKELSFSYEETFKLVKENYGIETGEDELKILMNTLDGWITGMHLILQSYGSSFTELHLDKILIFDDVFDYFTEDIFSGLEEEVKNFLLFTSVLDNFTLDICRKLFVDTDCSKIISFLIQKNIFININKPGSGSEQAYSYQALFKKFLNKKLNDTVDERKIRSFLSEYAGILLNSNRPAEAVNFLFKAGENEKAVNLVKLHFQENFDKGNYFELWSWLEHTGDEIIRTDYRLLFYKSLMLNFYIGTLEQSLQYIDQAVKLCKEAGDNNFLVRCYISKTRNLISVGKINEAKETLKMAEVPGTDTGSLSKLHYLRSYIYYQDSDYELALKELDNAYALAENSDFDDNTDLEFKNEILNLYGHIFLIKGFYSKSISYYERVVTSRIKLAGKYETLCNLVLLYSQSGKYEKALDYLAKADEICGKLPIPIFRITFLLAKQAFLFEFGDFEQSIKLLLEMNKMAAELNHKYYIFLSYSLLGDSYLSLGKPGKAEEYYDLAFKYLNDNNKLEKIQYSVSKALLLKIINPISEIEPVLLNAYGFYDSLNMLNSKIQISFHLADYYRMTGQYDKTLHYLKEALGKSEENEYNSFIQREIINFRALYDFAVSNSIYKKYLLVNLNAVKDKWNADWISDECRERFSDMQEKFFGLKILLFGKNDVYLRGKLLDDAVWNKKKWKSIFIYLILSPNRKLSKDKIIDLFYPDTSPESADNIFHQMISRFRSLLKITSEEISTDPGITNNKKNSRKNSGEKTLTGIKLFPAVITYEDKTLQLDDSFSIYSDISEFEKIYKQIPLIKDTGRRKELLIKAISLYKGDFMGNYYDSWCEDLRTKYFSYFTEMNEQLLKLNFSENEFDKTILFSENYLKYDNLSLTAYEYLLSSLVNSGKKQSARLRYTKLRKDYKSEYGEILPLSLSKKFENIIEN